MNNSMPRIFTTAKDSIKAYRSLSRLLH